VLLLFEPLPLEDALDVVPPLEAAPEVVPPEAVPLVLPLLPLVLPVGGSESPQPPAARSVNPIVSAAPKTGRLTGQGFEARLMRTV
jgi:hypothetical protein